MDRKPPRQIATARELRRGSTDAESLLWADLRNMRLNGHRFVRQHPIDRFVVDFACRSRGLVVEVDGSQHAASASDAVRTTKLNALGWAVLRFWNDEVIGERQDVCETILAVLDGRLSEASRGTGFFRCLRFAPATPSPGRAARAARPPSPASGRGSEPVSDASSLVGRAS